ncbi:MAG TPA: M56 family metallopeptidase, partial [Polyangiales bacterium]|nr:M56 family metallopeptidase [Polyangiales bacterium]
ARALSRLLARTTLAPAELQELVRVRAAGLGIAPPELALSSQCAIPFATGLGAARIVLPNELVQSLDRAALELVVEHELEHVRRGDTRFAALVASMQILLGGHPTARKVAREALLAREIAVDARVAQSGARAYASLLVDIAAHAHFGEKPASTAIDDSALARRIALITEPAPTRPLSLWPLSAAAAAIALATLAASTCIAWSLPARPFGVFHARGQGVLPGHPAPAFFGHALPVPPPEARLPELIDQAPEVRACYQRAAGAPMHARIGLQVGAGGKLQPSVSVPGAPEVQTCLERALENLAPRLPAPPGAAWTIGLEVTQP